MLSLHSILCELEHVNLVLLASITILDKEGEEEILLLLSHLIIWDFHYARFVQSISSLGFIGLFHFWFLVVVLFVNE